MQSITLAPSPARGARNPRITTDVTLTDDPKAKKGAETLKPPLKWAGGKRWLVPSLVGYWEAESTRRYIEPFCGGLSVPLGLIPTNAILNDMNRHVINFYKWVQRGLHVQMEMRNDKAFYYASRERFNHLIDTNADETQEAAELFYYLNRTCYNGLCRFNRKGRFNVPFGKYKTINYLPNFDELTPQLAAWTFTAGDFESIPLQSGDFVYADPPYDVQFVSYSQQGFNWDDQVRLAHWLATHDAPVIISNQATDRIMELYQDLGYACITLPAPRRISCNGDRKPALEVLAMRNITPPLLTDGRV